MREELIDKGAGLAERENPTSHSYFSQRLRLHYLDWGNADAPAMLMVHGVHDHCHSWDWLAPAFADRYHIVAPDLRGHGDSEWTRGSAYTHLEYVQDIAQLVRQQKLEPVTLVAHSMGGTIAAIYAGIYPEAIERIVIIEGIGLYPERFGGPAHERLKGWIRSNYALAGRDPRRYATLEDAYQRMQKMNPHLTPDKARHLTIHGSSRNEDGSYMWKFDNYTRTPSPYEIPEADIMALWERIEAPVLIINSSQGYPHRIGQNGTDRHFKNVVLEVVDDAGHWTHHDQLEKCLEHMTSFLGP